MDWLSGIEKSLRRDGWKKLPGNIWWKRTPDLRSCDAEACSREATGGLDEAASPSASQGRG